MTTIDRLGIMGIRSYDPAEETYIKFLKPLTIILGNNGSGKSTIIEAVKMATTGDPPPVVDNCAAFIHDPRIDNQLETKARIRLEFTNISGEQYIVSRHFQLSLRVGPRGVGHKTMFKTLDQTLRRVDGTKSSFRAADLNNMLPEVMRVTKPVLNNVIFVHQEESLWPLGESKKVKDKFDEIFAATRYTKALESIRKYRKDQAGDLKAVKVELMHYEEKVRVLEKIRNEVDDIRVQHDGLMKGQEELTTKLTQMGVDLGEAETVLTNYKDKQEQLRKHQNDAKHLNQAKDEKYRAMQMHLPDLSEDDITSEMKDLEQKLYKAADERSKRAGLIEHLRVEIESKRLELNRRLAKRGMLEEKEKQQEERLERLETLKKDVSDKGMFSKPLSAAGKELAEPRLTDDLNVWTAALDGLKRDADANFTQVREECDASLDKANAVLSDVRLKLESAQRDERRMHGELAQKRTDIAATRSELDLLRRSQDSTSEADDKLKARENAFKEKSEKNNIKALKDAIAKGKRQITVLREDLGLARKTREQLLQDQSEQARLQLSRETAISKKRDFDSFFENFVESLVTSAELLGTMDEDGADLLDLKRELRRMTHDTELSVEEKRVKLVEASSRVLAKRDALVKIAEQGVNDAKAKLSELTIRKTEFKREVDKAKRELKRVDSELTRMKQQLGTADAELSEVSDVDAENDEPKDDLKVNHLVEMFEGVSIGSDDRRRVLRREHVDALSMSVGDADKAIQAATLEISRLQVGVHIAEWDLQRFEDSPRHRCPACGVSSSKKVEEMRNNLKQRVEKFKDPANLAKAEKQKRVVEGATDVVRRLQTHCENALSSMEMFTAAAARLRGVEEEERVARESHNKKSSAFADLQSRVGVGSCVEEIVSRRLEVRQRVSEYDRAAKDVKHLEASVRAETGESMSLNEADQKVQDIEEEMQTLQDKMERDGRALEREQDDLRLAENRLHAAKERALELKAMSEKYKRLEKEKEELSQGIVAMEGKIETVRALITTVKADRESAEVELAAVKAENTYRAKSANTEVSYREKIVQQWKGFVRDVDAYRRSGKGRELEMIKKSLDGIEKEIIEKSEDLKGLENDLATASDAQNDMKTRIRNLKDNRLYRLQEQSVLGNLRDMQRVEREIEEIERATGESPVDKVERMKEEKNRMNANLHATKAQRHVYRNQYEAKRKELGEAEKEGSRKKFDECRIRKQTMELASGDLDRYHRALDQALMAFHTLKMSSINRTIKELWQQTYQGSDIEEIEITSDPTEARSDGSGIARRNFNYRVVMRRGQATLDMRGRCSAGQKVLACLVIRLALAESFCTDCGILALDEPTTNLDRKNIESLAQALRAIIESRRSQRNFQLVLITHDEEFIEMIGARDFSSDYFKVYKNERQKSCAKMESLHEVGA